MHCFALAIGLGGATILDFVLLRSIRRPLDPANVAIFHIISNLVTLGLVLLWLSGLGFLIIYSQTDPALLQNPKLWAKVAIVVVLTINGIYIHRRVLPILQAQAGLMLFENLPPPIRHAMLTAAAVSTVSWYVPFLLGMVRELNFAAPAETFLAAYVVALVLVWSVMQGVGVLASTPHAISAQA